jgi:hypothetical protein
LCYILCTLFWLCPHAYVYRNLFQIRKNCWISGRSLLFYQFTRRAIKLTSNYGGMLISFIYRNWTSKASKLWHLHLGAVGINLPHQGFQYIILGIFIPKIWHHYSATCFTAWSSLYSDAIFTVMWLTSVFYGRMCSNLKKNCFHVCQGTVQPFTSSCMWLYFSHILVDSVFSFALIQVVHFVLTLTL